MHKTGIVLSVSLGLMMSLSALAQNQAQVVNVASSLTVNGEVMGRLINVGQNVSGEGCRISGLLNAGGSVHLKDCKPIGGIRAGQEVYLVDSEVQEDLTAGQQVRLEKTAVHGNVMAPAASLKHSTIQGTLYTADRSLVLDESHVGGIQINLGSSRTVLGTSSVVGNGSVIVQGGSSAISVSEHGTVKANGYTIEGRPGTTLIITPDGLVYANGVKSSSGKGPQDYDAYRQAHPGAPQVKGPGWESGRAESASSETSGEQPLAVVELKKGSVVSGDVVFKNGRGVVIVSPDSKLIGKVSGGTVQRK